MDEKEIIKLVKDFVITAYNGKSIETIFDENTVTFSFDLYGDREIDNTLRNMKYDIVKVFTKYNPRTIDYSQSTPLLDRTDYFLVTSNDWGIQSIEKTKHSAFTYQVNNMIETHMISSGITSGIMPTRPPFL